MSIRLRTITLILLILSIGLLSCTDSNKSALQKEYSIQSQTGNSKNSTLFTRNIRVENAWSSPVLIDSISSENFSISQFHGPTLRLNDTSGGFINWRLAGLQSANNNFGLNEKLLYRESVASAWTDVSSNLGIGNGSVPEIKIHNTTGISYFTWINGGEIYLQKYDPQSGWTTPMFIGIGDQPANLMIDANGNADLYWIVSNSAQMYEIHTRRFFIETQTLSNTQMFLKQTNGNENLSASQITASYIGPELLFVWQEIRFDTVNNQLVNLALLSANFSPDTGWKQSMSVSNLSADIRIDQVKLATNQSAGSAELVYTFSQTNQFGSFLNAFSFVNDAWQMSSITPMSTTSLRQNYQFASNTNGDIIVAWAELKLDLPEPMNYLQVLQFNAQQGWSDNPISLGDGIPFFLPANGFSELPLDLPSINLNDNGTAVISWLNFSTDSVNIFVNHYSPTSGWQTQQLVNSSGSPYVTNASVHIDNSGSSTIVWTESQDLINGKQYDIYSSLYSQSGTPVQPPPTAVPIPNPPLNLPADHATLNSNCFSCHDGVAASTKPPTHVPTTDVCESCHIAIAWIPLLTVDHAQVIGTCVACHNGVIAQGKVITHLPVTDECAACHTIDLWIPAIAVDHSQVVGVCSDCHDGRVATGKSELHIATTEQCDICHNTQNWISISTTPAPGAPVALPGIPLGHEFFAGGCDTCHDGILASGKSSTHINASNNCASCHIAIAWVPVITVDHTNVIGVCSDCHNNVIATGQPAHHLNTLDICDVCHSSDFFIPIIALDHSALLGTCDDCHNNVIATGKSPAHILSSDVCQECHRLDAWLPAFGGGNTTQPSVGLPAGHEFFGIGCVTCHNGVDASGKVANHINTSDNCETCHNNGAWIPVRIVNHDSVLGSCDSCHNNVIAKGKSPFHEITELSCESCHTTSNWLIPSANPTPFDHSLVTGICIDCHNGIDASGKSPNHISTTDDCDTCHNSQLWIPVVTVDHNEVLGACDSCHDSPRSHNQVGIESLCDTCHATQTWFNPTNPLPAAGDPPPADGPPGNNPAPFDHSTTDAPCVDCHESPLTHIDVGVTSGCESCHSIDTWFNPNNPLPAP